jgi:multiple sugar transport system substrate-binding protein
VWFNSLVDSDNGAIITGTNKVVIGPSTRTAAEIMHELATSPAADPSLNVAKEDPTRIAFEGGTAAFMINYPYVWPSAQKDVPKTIFPNMGYAAFPTVAAGTAPKVSIGGYNLGISAFSKHPSLAFEAAQCLTTQSNEITYAEKGGLAPVRGAVYSIPSFIKQYPFASLIRKQLENYGIRPQTPAYADVTLAIQKALSPTSSINPSTVVKTLRNEVKLSLSSEALL